MKRHYIYIVFNRMNSGRGTSRGDWYPADFWSMPYASTRFREAQQYKRQITERALRFRKSIWHINSFKVFKVDISQIYGKRN